MDWTGLDWTGGEGSVSEWEWARSQSEEDRRRLREGRASAVRLRLGRRCVEDRNEARNDSMATARDARALASCL